MDSVPIVGGYPLLDIRTAYFIHPTLDQLKPLDKETAASWVKYWIEEKFLASTLSVRL